MLNVQLKATLDSNTSREERENVSSIGKTEKKLMNKKRGR